MKLSSCEGCEDCARGLYAYPYISKIDTIRNIAAPANETGNNTNNTTTINVLDPNISKLTYNIWLHGGIFLIVLGTIGNSLSMTVMMRKNLRRHTAALYLMELAVVDTAVLYNWFVRNWTNVILGIDTRLLTLRCQL